jgi:hypothetical protein
MGAILDKNKNLYGAGEQEIDTFPVRVGNTSVSDEFSPLNRNTLTNHGLDPHGVIPLGTNIFLGIGLDWAGVRTLANQGLAVWRVNRNTVDNTITGIDLVKLIQSPSSARIPKTDEKRFRNDSLYSFTPMGRFWLVDAWVTYPTYGKRRHLGLFNVESHDYLDLKNRWEIINKINAGRVAIDQAGGQSTPPLLTDLGIFRF